MRLSFCIVLFCQLAVYHCALAQSDDDKFSRAAFKGGMTNEDVIDAKRWHHEGLLDKSLEKGFEIISSNVQLTAIDSFNTYQVLAYNFRDIKAYDLALEYAEKAVYINLRINGDTTDDAWIAPYYSAVKNYPTAINYLKQDIDKYKNVSDTLALLKLYNDIGFTYYLDTDFVMAMQYYNAVREIGSKANKYKGIMGLATGNLGVIYLEKGDFNAALANMKIDADLSKGRDPESYYNAMNAMGECYYMMGNYPKAESTLLVLTEIPEAKPKGKLKTYDLLARVYENTNQPAESLNYLKKYISIQEAMQKSETSTGNILKQLSDSKISGIKKDLEIAKGKVDLINSELQLTQNRIKAQTMKTRVYIIASILIFGSLVLLIVSHKNRQKKNEKIHLLQTELIESDLKTKKQDLTNVVTNLNYVRKFIDMTLDKLKNIETEASGEVKQNISKLIREFSSYNNADKSIAVLQSDIENVNLAFFKKLDEKFPLLTQNEKELCGLLLLKLSSKDIAVIRNVSPNAVKKARQRVRKKLPISEDQKIAKFLETI